MFVCSIHAVTLKALIWKLHVWYAGTALCLGQGHQVKVTGEKVNKQNTHVEYLGQICMAMSPGQGQGRRRKNGPHKHN